MPFLSSYRTSLAGIGETITIAQLIDAQHNIHKIKSFNESRQIISDHTVEVCNAVQDNGLS